MNRRAAFVGLLAAGMFGVHLRPSGFGGQAGPVAEGQQDKPEQAVASGVREAAWSPDGKRVAVTRFETIWTMAPDGRDARRLVVKPESWAAERDPAWSPDGKSIVFSASTNGQFDLWIAPATGGAARRVTSLPGDERWASWTRDGRLLFSHRPPRGRWQLYLANADAAGEPIRFSPEGATEWQGRVSPDGKLVAFVSDREPEPNSDADLWVRELPEAGRSLRPGEMGRTVRLTRSAGSESFPAWAPDNARVAYAAPRNAQQNLVWVISVPSFDDAAAPAGQAGRGRPGGPGRGRPGGAGPAAAADPGTVVVASRHGGVPAWSPDGQTLLIATFLTTDAGYNGDPNRSQDDPPSALSASTSDYALWRVAAPRPVDEHATSLSLAGTDAARWTSAFDQIWQTLKSMYYSTGESSAAWDALRQKYRPEMSKATDAASAEAIIDRMIAEQPLIRPAIES
ncbi:MAG TPA: hypothetical protein VH679_07970, partial [Vicinamibacterales bacterium]